MSIKMSEMYQMMNSNESDASKGSIRLYEIVKALGWQSFRDNRAIKPNLRSAQKYIHKHAAHLGQLFPDIDFRKLAKDVIVDIINPLIIEKWHAQIVGTTALAWLELLQKVT
jgi:hypothetical protein